MKIIALLLLALLPFHAAFAETTANLKPYILGFETTETIAATQKKVGTALDQNGVRVVGQYKPAADENRAVLIISSPELQGAVKQIGGLTGFASTLRVGITRENGKTLVTYTNPLYWGNAYFRADFDKVAPAYTALNEHIEKALKSAGTFLGTPFGSADGISAKELRKYHYLVGMPYFTDVVELGAFESHAAALAKVEASLKHGVPGVSLYSKVAIPGENIVLFNLALTGDKGESKFLPVIDIATPKHTAFLPYEVLVLDKRVLFLPGRYRIALSFPDLTMGTFTKIISTPGDIETSFKQLVK